MVLYAGRPFECSETELNRAPRRADTPDGQGEPSPPQLIPSQVPDDVERRRLELCSLSSKYAAMKFEAYQLFNDNRAPSMALSTMLPENRRLRKLAAERSLGPYRQEPWDDWSQEDIDRFHKKYVYSLKGT